jgi:hypothetical protein
MAKRAALGLGLGVALALALWAWDVLRDVGQREREAPSSVRRPSSPRGALDAQGGTAGRPADHVREHELPVGDLGLDIVSQEVVDQLATEADEILRSMDDPRPPTVEEVTRERLAHRDLPQTVHGVVDGIDGLKQMLEPGDKALRVYGRTRGGRTVSASAVIEGEFTLGQLDSGSYTVFLAERERMPGIVIEIDVDQGQAAQEVALEPGRCNIEVKVTDEAGAAVESDDIELFVGGTDDAKHMFKRAGNIRNGTWRVNGLWPGQYIASAQAGDTAGGAVVDLRPGMNSCTIQLRPRADVE